MDIKKIRKIFKRERNLFTDIFVLFIAISIITTIITGFLFYFYTTTSMVADFNRKTAKTASEISDILSLSLYNVDNDGVIKNAKIYLLSGSLSGIEIYSSADGLLIKEIKNEVSLIKPIKVELINNNIYLGTAKFWFDDSEIKNTQRTMIIFIFITVIISAIVSGTFIYLIINYLFRPALTKIQMKIEEVAGGAYQNLLTDSKYDEFNQIIKSVNHMSLEINSKTEKLSQSEKKYSEIFNNIYVGVMVHDTNGKVIDVNETLMKMFGLKSKEEAFRYSVKTDYSDSKNPIDKMESSWKAVINGRERHFEWIARKPLTGEVFNVFISLKKFVLDDNTYLLANIIDITDRKIAEEKLIHAQKMEALGTLSGGLAHDFNNTLVGITAPLSLLEMSFKKTDFPDKEKFNEYLSIMKESARRAVGIINQLLSIARKQNFQFEKTDLVDLMQNLIKFSENTIDKSIEIIYKHPDTPAIINGDKNQIEQVFLNLIVNASHSMTFMKSENEKWGGSLEITISRFTPDEMFLKINTNMKHQEYWQIDFKDSGIGISKENLQKIFNPFFTTKDRGKGTGLGLSMVYNIIKQHDGHINVYSEPGYGTIFNVYIPILKDDSSGKIVSADKTNKEINRREGLILVIDDEENVRKTVKIMLENCGYNTFTSSDCIEGMEYFSSNFENIDAVLLDFSMPKHSGKDVFQELIKIDPGVKVLLTSGFGLDDRTAPLLDSGVKGFLKKPFTFEQLIESLDNILKK